VNYRLKLPRSISEYIQYFTSHYWNQHQRTPQSLKTLKSKARMMNMRLNEFWITSELTDDHFIWLNGKGTISLRTHGNLLRT